MISVSRRYCAILAFPTALTLQGALCNQAEAACPTKPVVSIASPDVPADACVPDGFPGNPIAFFDDYSWKSFAALVWPAAAGKRGVPDPAKKVGDTSGPLVFETFKADWELFQAQPTAWDTYPASDPCGSTNPLGFDDFELASFSKFGNLGQAGFGDLVHALPAQNKTWVRFATAFNRVEYDQIFNNQLYIMKNLKAAEPITFQDTALDVKSSWIDMTNVANPKRYYTRMAKLMDPVTGQCNDTLVGLVGLHIVQKTASRPQWIWTTFEQVDNVPGDAGGKAPLGFNDGTGTPMPATDPNGSNGQFFPPKDWANPVVFNVTRTKNIHPSTVGTNALYQKALAGTVWQFYELVMTQWPVPPNGVPAQGPVPATQAGSPPFTFPGTGATTSFTNATLETWDQKSISTGCMACHNVTKRSDFLWTLQANAVTTTTTLLNLRATQSPELKALRQFMLSQ